jgi:acyl-CoA reductase-like NAD-dependent aldehyde dehydrogenase
MTRSSGNDTTCGLAAAALTRDISRAHQVARALKSGTVWVNCYSMIDTSSPFGGYKQSGFGREGGRPVIDLLTQIKSAYVKLVAATGLYGRSGLYQREKENGSGNTGKGRTELLG